MSVNIQQADKTLKKVADTTVVNKSTVIGALEYTPVSTDQLNTIKTDLTNSIDEVSSNLSTTANNLQQQINALEDSAFDGDYNKLTNAPILNDADGTATFADETGNIIARIDNNGLETTNLNLHGDIELADEKLEIIDEIGNIVLRIDDNGVETKNINEIKKQLSDTDTLAKNNANLISNIQEDLEIFNFGDTGGLTIADEQGNIIAKFDVAEDGSQTGLITTDVTFEYGEDETKTLTALNAEVAANTDAIAIKAPIESPAFTGTPIAPTPVEGAGETQIATVGYVTTAVSEVARDVAELPFEFNDDGALTIADEQGNILAQFAVEEDAEGNVIETGLRVTDVATNSINSLNTEINNRYTKAETDEKIAEAIVNAEHLKRIIVDVLPTTGIDKCAIYMLKAASTETRTQDIYDEYMYINNAWERLGSWQTDLTDYTKKAFKTITVGTVNIEADSNADTLTLVAGDNITLTANTENDTITITSSYVDTGTGFTSVEIAGEGNAITNVTPEDRKLTFTKGEFTTKQEYTDFKNGFDEKFDFKTNENGLDITDGNNIIATFDNNGLRTTTVILGDTNNGALIDLMNIDYDSLFAFDVNEIVDGENLPVNLTNDELLLTDSEGDYIVVEKGE